MNLASEPFDPRIAAYAVTTSQSLGRDHDEAPPAYRSEFQRDRDRIIHSSAFRRLEYKTQVFVNHEGDMFRTRLTHSLEVAQIARTVARALNLNEDLTEAIALAHDLGHSPFGHAGQSALNACMSAHGGFEHNLQSLRVVEYLEERYPDFRGLNLLFETREGILKHCSVARAKTMGRLGERFIENKQPSLEAQLTNIADEIAYNHHDIDDGLRANLLGLEQLLEFPLFKDHHEAAMKRWRGSSSKRILYSVIREMLNYFVTDLIVSSRQRIESLAPENLHAVREADSQIIDFSATVKEQHLKLKRLLRSDLYNHAQVLRNAGNAQLIVSRLFKSFLENPEDLPQEQRAEVDHRVSHAQIAADYVAGMTDRFAISEYRRLFGHNAFSETERCD